MYSIGMVRLEFSCSVCCDDAELAGKGEVNINNAAVKMMIEVAQVLFLI